MTDDSESQDEGDAPAPPTPPVERKLSESQGGFRKGVDVLPAYHVDPQDAPPMGGLPAAQADAADTSTSAGDDGDSGSSASESE